MIMAAGTDLIGGYLFLPSYANNNKYLRQRSICTETSVHVYLLHLPPSLCLSYPLLLQYAHLSMYHIFMTTLQRNRPKTVFFSGNKIEGGSEGWRGREDHIGNVNN